MTPRRPQRRRPMRDRGRSARRPLRPARGAPGPGSRALPPCCAGSTPWSSTTLPGIPPSPPVPPAARRRPPDQRFHPAPATGAQTFLPDEGESEPVPASGTNPVRHPGQLSPGRPELLTSSVERCRGRPARATRAGRARLHYVEREDPGDGHPQPPAARPSSRRGTPACPRRPHTRASQATPEPAVARTHSSEASSQNHQETLPNRLTDSLLRWCHGDVLRWCGDAGGGRDEPGDQRDGLRQCGQAGAAVSWPPGVAGAGGRTSPAGGRSSPAGERAWWPAGGPPRRRRAFLPYRSCQRCLQRVLQYFCRGAAGVQVNSVPQTGQGRCSAVTGWLPFGGGAEGVGAVLVGAHPVGGAVDAGDDAAVQETIQCRGGEHRVAEPLGPGGDPDVGCGDDASFEVAGVDDLEQQGPRFLVQGAVGELVEDQQLRGGEVPQPGGEAVLGDGAAQPGGSCPRRW